LTHWHDD